MSGNNKYGSLIETFTSNPLINELLSSFATPPADFTILPADIPAQPFLYSSGSGANPTVPLIKFAINDKPRIIGVGLFANIADGLVYQDNPDEIDKGPSFSLELGVYDAANAFVVGVETRSFRVPELNQIFEVDHLYNVSAVAQTEDSLRFAAGFAGSSMTFSTLSIDPAYAAKRFILRPVVVIEHTFPLTVV
jgi:hypothetical protein